MERIKDFFYDLSDILVSLIIIAIIFGVVSWKLNDTMPIPIGILNNNNEQRVVETVAIPKTTVAEIDITQSGAGTPSEQVTIQPTETVTTQVETTSVTLSTKDIKVTIPSGSSGDKIARILKAKGVIKDTSEFLKVVANLNLGNKLRAGTFTLNPSMSYEKIARVLTGN